MVPFENLKGVAVTVKGLMTRIRILCKQLPTLLSSLKSLGDIQPKDYFARYFSLNNPVQDISTTGSNSLQTKDKSGK